MALQAVESVVSLLILIGVGWWLAGRAPSSSSSSAGSSTPRLRCSTTDQSLMMAGGVGGIWPLGDVRRTCGLAGGRWAT